MSTATMPAPIPLAERLAQENRDDAVNRSQAIAQARSSYVSILGRNATPHPDDAFDLRQILPFLGLTLADFTADILHLERAIVQQNIVAANADVQAIVAETAALRHKRDAMRKQFEEEFKAIDREVHISEQRHTARSNAEAALLRLSRERPHLVEPAKVTPPASLGKSK